MSSKKLDAAIDALLMRWPSCPSTSLRVGSAATGWGCTSYVAWPGLSRLGAGDGAGSAQVGVSALPAPQPKLRGSWRHFVE